MAAKLSQGRCRWPDLQAAGDGHSVVTVKWLISTHKLIFHANGNTLLLSAGEAVPTLVRGGRAAVVALAGFSHGDADITAARGRTALTCEDGSWVLACWVVAHATVHVSQVTTIDAH
jgi:hypothetical protein